MGVQSFAQLKQQTPISNDPTANSLVKCVAASVVASIPGDLAKRVDVPRDKWEVVVFQDDTPNAFALPGGKIGVHTGMLKVARTPDQLAAVIGHEVAHVLAEHGNERISQALAAESGMALLGAIAATNDPEKAKTRQLVLGLIGLGAQVGILLPFSRTHESEADKIGLDLMARAGFNPAEAVTLWQNMEKAGGGQPPEFLSTHPSHGTRIADLRARQSIAVPLYQQALQSGRRPACVRAGVAAL